MSPDRRMTGNVGRKASAEADQSPVQTKESAEAARCVRETVREGNGLAVART